MHSIRTELMGWAAFLVFVAVVSATGVTRSDVSAARAYGPVVKATTTTTIAGSGHRQVGRAARGNVIITAITRTDS